MKYISCSLLILHAEDDPVVPFHLGKKVCVWLCKLIWWEELVFCPARQKLGSRKVYVEMHSPKALQILWCWRWQISSETELELAKLIKPGPITHPCEGVLVWVGVAGLE